MADQPSTRPSASSAGAAELTFVVYGPDPVTSTYAEPRGGLLGQAPRHRSRSSLRHPRTRPWPRSQAATAKGDPPDLFEIDGDDLPGLMADKAVHRVDDLLTDRQVDFGDGYSRSALEAFSSDSAL